MSPLEFSSRITVKVAPIQLYQIKKRIKRKIKELKSKKSKRYVDLTTFDINKIDITDNDLNSLLSKIESEFVERYKDKKLIFECQKDLLNIEETLFKFNMTHNVSKKLSKIKILKKKIKYYKNFKECLICEKNVKKTLIKAKDFLENSDIQTNKTSINILFYDIDEVKNLLKEINREILQLEKEIAFINTSNEIEIAIGKNIAEIVGID